jgi:hypothetical protein
VLLKSEAAKKMLCGTGSYAVVESDDDSIAHVFSFAPSKVALMPPTENSPVRAVNYCVDKRDGCDWHDDGAFPFTRLLHPPTLLDCLFDCLLT